MEVSTLNSTATNKTGQLIGDDKMQSHQQKSQLIINTISITTKSNSHANNLSNSNSTLNKSNATMLNYDNNHNSPPLLKITEPTNDESVKTNEQNLITADNNVEKEVKETVKQMIDNIVSTSINHQQPATTTISDSAKKEQMAVDAVSTTLDLSEPKQNNEKLINQGDDLDDLGEDKTEKDMVILRNLEISPPPPPPASHDEIAATNEEKANGQNSTKRASKRKLTATPESTSELNESNESTGRSKRQRTQTKLFQVGDAPKFEVLSVPTTNSSKNKSSRTSTGGVRKKSTVSSASNASLSTTQDAIIQHSNDLPDVICYEKNDYLAIRNEENTFYLCLLVENVRARRQFIKVKWLDTNDDGKSYFLTSQFDKVPQRSIIMPVNLIKVNSAKKGEQIFTLDDQARDNIMERLRRSLNASSEITSSQETKTDDE